MLDAVVEYMPSPVDMPPVKGSTERDHEDDREADDDAPFSALAFKILNDPFVGNLTFFRVYSGVLNSGDQVYIPAQGPQASASAASCRCTRTSARRSRKSAPATSPRSWASRT